MKKQVLQLEPPLEQTGEYVQYFCPLCGRVIENIVPAESITYIVHALDNLCVIDNQPGQANG